MIKKQKNKTLLTLQMLLIICFLMNEFLLDALAQNSAQDPEEEEEGSVFDSPEILSLHAAYLMKKGTREDLKEALKKSYKACKLLKSAKEPLGEASTLFMIGSIHLLLKEYDKALEKLNESLVLMEKVGDSSMQATVASSTATVYLARNEYKKALEIYNRTLPRFQSPEDRQLLGAMFNYIGGIHILTGEKRKGLEYLEKNLAIQKESKDYDGLAITLGLMASVHSSLGEQEKALSILSEALALQEQDPKTKANIYSSIANVYESKSEFQQALYNYDKALTLAKENKDSSREAEILEKQAIIYDKFGEEDKALTYYKSSFSKKDQNTDIDASILHNLGSSYIRIDQKIALEYLNQALTLTEKENDLRSQAPILTTMAGIYGASGDKKKVFEFLNKALSIARNFDSIFEESNILSALGYFSVGEEALSYHKQALLLRSKIGNKQLESQTRFAIATIEKDNGNFQEALKQINEALKLVEFIRINAGSQKQRTFYLGTVQNYYEFYIDLLMKMHSDNPEKQYDIEALKISEQARSRSLLEILTESRANIRKDISPELLQKERGFTERLNAKVEYQSRLLAKVDNPPTPQQIEDTKKEIQEIIDELQILEVKIRQESPRYGEIKYPGLFDIVKFQKEGLDKDTVLLEYFLGKEKSYLWAVTKTSVKSYTLKGRDEIENLASTLYELLTVGEEKEPFETNKEHLERIKKTEPTYWAKAATLSDLILSPVSDIISNKRLLIVSDGLLQFIPFSALPEPKEIAKNVPLIVNHEIVNLPSASVTLYKPPIVNKTSKKTIAMFANPIFAQADKQNKTGQRTNNITIESELSLYPINKTLSGLAPLQETQDMVEKIIKDLHLSEKDLKPFFGFDANLRAATNPELKNFSIIHYATHGILNPNPELSGIFFSLVDVSGREQPGFLSTPAIFNLDLPVELVVLGACQTGLITNPLKKSDKKILRQQLERIKGQGLTGLTRGFIYAGTKRVMASLWKVDVNATSELMLKFYAKLLDKNAPLSPSASLREAQKNMWQNPTTRFPYFWAGFTITGEYR